MRGIGVGMELGEGGGGSEGGAYVARERILGWGRGVHGGGDGREGEGRYVGRLKR